MCVRLPTLLICRGRSLRETNTQTTWAVIIQTDRNLILWHKKIKKG